MQQESVTIIGAGLVGSLLAVMLGQRGYSVRVREKRPDLRRERIPAGRSINLALAERGLNALRLANLEPLVEPLLIPMRERMLHQTDGRLVRAPYGQRPEEVIYSVSRLELNQLLLTAAEATGRVHVDFRTVCTSVDLDRQEVTLLDEATGNSRKELFSHVLGADGSASILRSAIVAAAQGTNRYDRLDHDYKELSILADANGQWRIERDALHIWPRGEFMLIALPNRDGSFTVTLFLPHAGSPSFATLSSPARVQEFFSNYFSDARELIADLNQSFFQNPTGELGTLRCWPWTDGRRALVLGDAAHAIVPFHGQGMNAGFEDCAEFLVQLEQRPGDWSTACQAFAEVRKPQAEAIADMALENYIDMRDTVQHPDFLRRKQLGFELERRFPRRFIPRYSLVMFHRIPYAEAQRRGKVQDQILDQLIVSTPGLDATDWPLAERLVTSQLGEIPAEWLSLAVSREMHRAVP